VGRNSDHGARISVQRRATRMTVRSLRLLVLAFGVLSGGTVNAANDPNPRLEFVVQFINLIGEDERLREIAYNETQEDKTPKAKLMSAIRSNARYQIDYRLAIQQMKNIKLDAKYARTNNEIADIADAKLNAIDLMAKISKELLEAPKPNV